MDEGEGEMGGKENQCSVERGNTFFSGGLLDPAAWLTPIIKGYAIGCIEKVISVWPILASFWAIIGGSVSNMSPI